MIITLHRLTTTAFVVYLVVHLVFRLADKTYLIKGLKSRRTKRMNLVGWTR